MCNMIKASAEAFKYAFEESSGLCFFTFSCDLITFAAKGANCSDAKVFRDCSTSFN